MGSITAQSGKPPFGSLAWAERSRGRVSGGERLAQAMVGLRLLLVERPRLFLYSLGLTHGSAERLIDEVPRPRSPVAASACAEMERCSPAFVAGHSHRTYLLGWMLGRVRGLTCDAELLYVASMLHDLSLTESYAFRTPDTDCFAFEGARLAGDFLRERGWESERSRAASEAICQHVNVQVPISRGVEAHLLNAGAACDLTGLAMQTLCAADLQRVVEQHPRDGLAEGFAALMDQQVARRPASRARMLQMLGLRKLIDRAPF